MELEEKFQESRTQASRKFQGTRFKDEEQDVERRSRFKKPSFKRIPKTKLQGKGIKTQARASRPAPSPKPTLYAIILFQLVA